MKNKRQREILLSLLLTSGIILIGLIGLFVFDRYSSNNSVIFRIEEGQEQIYKDKKWQELIIRGINITPRDGSDDFNNEELSKNAYKRWFRQLASDGVNIVQLNTILPPAFYQAFFEYNILTDKPLYLLHGVMIDERNVNLYLNAYEDKLINDLFDEITRTIDIVNGKATFRQPNRKEAVTYKANITPYVIGYILCESENTAFITATNEKNPNIVGFEGDYLYTWNASPYEAWLAAVGNYMIYYEQEKYGGPFRHVSWTGLSNQGYGTNTEIDKATGVNFANIHITEKFDAGIMAFQKFPGTY